MDSRQRMESENWGGEDAGKGARGRRGTDCENRALFRGRGDIVHGGG